MQYSKNFSQVLVGFPLNYSCLYSLKASLVMCDSSLLLGFVSQQQKEATAAPPHSRVDPSHHMEEVVIFTTPMLWMWMASYYPQLNALTTCTRITASYSTRKAILLETIQITLMVIQLVVGKSTQNHLRLSMPGLSSPLLIHPLLSLARITPWRLSLWVSPRLKDKIRYFVPWNPPLTPSWINKKISWLMKNLLLKNGMNPLEF